MISVILFISLNQVRKLLRFTQFTDLVKSIKKGFTEIASDQRDSPLTSIVGTARAAIAAMKRHRGFPPGPSTVARIARPTSSVPELAVTWFKITDYWFTIVPKLQIVS